MTMFKKFIKFSFVLGCILALLTIASWLVVKQIATTRAAQKAEIIIETAYEQAPSQTPDEKITAIAKYVFQHFKEVEIHKNPLLRFRGYLTNKKLPEFLRLGDGVIETHIESGMCDNAGRMLAFILNQDGYSSVQWNMVAPKGTHSALLVSMPDGRKVLVDPFYGFVAADEKDHLLSPETAYKRISEGIPTEEVFKPLGENSRIKFYKDFKNVSMSAAGTPLRIEATIPDFDKELILGKIDNDYSDVSTAGLQHDMTYVWHYAGHLYNREWVRVLKADKSVRVVMTLVSDVEDGVVTSEPKPMIEDKKMIWDLNAGDKITFYDGRAQVSPTRLNSFIGVDQIAFYER